jgi:ArsR family transcriptional regulator
MLPKGPRCMDAAEMFKALSDRTRLRIVNLLARHKTVVVSHLVAALQLPQWRISRHLTRLRQLGLVRARREGNWMHYSIPEELRQTVRRVLAAVAEKLDSSVIATDLRRLQAVRRARRASGEA